MQRSSIIGIVAGAAALLLWSCSTSQGTTETVTAIGTFNTEWLGDGVADTKVRKDADYLAIADIIQKTDADVLGLQEVENEAALKKVLRYLEGYAGFVCEGGGKQHVAVVYRNGVDVKKVGTYWPLAIDPARNRPGLVVRCAKGALDWTMMIVHLKSTSRYDSTAELRELSRVQRGRQAEVLRAWMDSCIADGTETDVVICGDFNDFPLRRQQPTLTQLVENDKAVFLTDKLKSCSSPQLYTIDHLYVSRSLAARLIPESERTENFRAFLAKEIADNVSDHCPVVARFDVLGTSTSTP